MNGQTAAGAADDTQPAPLVAILADEDCLRAIKQGLAGRRARVMWSKDADEYIKSAKLTRPDIAIIQIVSDPLFSARIATPMMVPRIIIGKRRNYKDRKYEAFIRTVPFQVDDFRAAVDKFLLHIAKRREPPPTITKESATQRVIEADLLLSAAAENFAEVRMMEAEIARRVSDARHELNYRLAARHRARNLARAFYDSDAALDAATTQPTRE